MLGDPLFNSAFGIIVTKATTAQLLVCIEDPALIKYFGVSIAPTAHSPFFAVYTDLVLMF